MKHHRYVTSTAFQNIGASWHRSIEEYPLLLTTNITLLFFWICFWAASYTVWKSQVYFFFKLHICNSYNRTLYINRSFIILYLFVIAWNKNYGRAYRGEQDCSFFDKTSHDSNIPYVITYAFLDFIQLLCSLNTMIRETFFSGARVQTLYRWIYRICLRVCLLYILNVCPWILLHEAGRGVLSTDL